MWCKGCTQEKGMTNCTEARPMKAINMVEEEHHAILFLYKADRDR